jgi:hypothetical protein
MALTSWMLGSQRRGISGWRLARFYEPGLGAEDLFIGCANDLHSCESVTCIIMVWEPR